MNSVLTQNSLTKKFKMKKVLFVLALGAFAACGGSGSTDSAAAAADSARIADSTRMADSAAAAAAAPMQDTTKKDSTAVDSTKH